MACYTEQEIAKEIDRSQQTVNRWLEGFTQIEQLSDSGKTDANFAESFESNGETQPGFEVLKGYGGVESGASPSRWTEADCYHALSQRGWSVRKIAEACNTNRQTVSVFSRMVSRYGDSADRPSFWPAYAEVTGEKSKGAHVSHNAGENEWYSPEQFVNYHRRHLTKNAKALSASRYQEEAEREKAKERQRESGGDKKSEKARENRLRQHLPQPIRQAEARTIAGEKYGVSGKSVDVGKKVLSKSRSQKTPDS